MSLHATLLEVRSRIERARSRKLNELNTKATLIEPVLRALGWDTEDVEEVQREFKIKRRDKPVDYGLLSTRTPRLFVEAKGLGENLDDRRWANQIMGYASVAGVQWIVLTDGNEYRIYNSHAPVSVDKKLFRSVKITDEGNLAEKTLELLAKKRLEEPDLAVLWRAQFVDTQVKSALEQVFTPDGDMVVVNYVASRTKELTTEEIRESLRRCRPTFDFPTPTSVVEVGRHKKRRPGKAGTVRPNPAATSDVSLAHLIRAGIITAPADLEKRYKGQVLKARVESDGQVRFAGQLYASPSTAGAMARASIVGMRSNGRPPATNGWGFWRIQARDGSWAPLGDLRGLMDGHASDEAAG